MEREERGLGVTSREEKTVNLIDVFMYLVSYWKCFLVSILVFGGYFWYDYCKTPFMYSKTAVVMIKTPANTQATMRMNRYNNFMTGPVNVASEILQFSSKELMRKVVKRLGTDVSYTVRSGLRRNELYSDAPVRVSFIDAAADDFISLSATPRADERVLLSGFAGSDEEVYVGLGDTVYTPAGRLWVEPTTNYGDEWTDKAVKVTKMPLESMVGFFLSHLSIKQMDDDASLLQMFMKDRSASRAADMLEMLIAAYNEEAIEDKNRIAINTAEFIKGRLAIIEKELGTVESNIERLKTANEGVDVSTTVGMYITDVQQSRSEVKGLDAQLEMMQFMKQHLEKTDNADNLIPNNTGLVENEVEDKISRYNNLLLKRNRLMEGKGGNNPVVQEMDRTLQILRQEVVWAVDNRISTLNIKQKETSSQSRR